MSSGYNYTTTGGNTAANPYGTPGTYGASSATTPLPAVTVSGQQRPATVIAGQVAAWALGEYKAAGYDDATAKDLAAKAGAQAQTTYDEAIAAGKTPLEAASGARATAGGSVVGELQKVGVTNLSNPAALGLGGSGGTGSMGSPDVTGRDRSMALDTYRQGVAQGQQQLGELLKDPVNDPNARDTFQRVQGRDVATPTIVAPTAPTASRAVAAGPITTTKAVAAGPVQVERAVAAGPIQTAQVGPAARLSAAIQRGTTVAATGLDTAQSDQARTQQQAAIDDLTATSQGRGQAQLAAQARDDASINRQAALLAASARTQRGVDRKGALRAARLQAGELGQQARTEGRIANAQTSAAAQGALTGALQGVRSTDVDVAAKRAQLDQTRATLQAQLDAARAQGDAQRVQEIGIKMADLDREADRLNVEAQNNAREAAAGRETAVSTTNAGLVTGSREAAAGRETAVSTTNATQDNAAKEGAAGRETTVSVGNAAQENALKSTAYTTEADIAKQNASNQITTQTGNADRDVKVQETNNQQGREAVVAGTNQDVAQAELRIKVVEAIQRSGQGLLDQEGRDEALAIAKSQLALAQQRGDREAQSFWYDKISVLLTAGATIAGGLIGGPGGAAAGATAGKVATDTILAAKGGVVSRPTKAIIGEGQHREIVIPIKGKLSKALEKKLAIEAKPFTSPVPVASLLAVIKKANAALREPPAKKAGHRHVEKIAAYNTRAKKGA